MKDETREAIEAEVARARKKFPGWPNDIIHAAGIVCEESGELIRGAIQVFYEAGSIDATRKEAIRTAATCVRFLENG